MDFPTIEVSTPLAVPLSGGLYDAASVQDSDSARHLGGLTLEPSNTGTAGLWPAAGATEDTPPKQAERPDRVAFDATVVWVADGVKTVAATEEGVRQRNEHLMRLLEPVQVERFVAEKLRAGDPKETAVSLEAQLSQIEQELGETGRAGVVHASRAMLPYLNKFVTRQGQSLFTPGGHRWAFGGGYEALGTDLVGTGPVVVVRGPVTAAQTIDARHNQYEGIAERVVAVGWEGPTIRVPRADA